MGKILVEDRTDPDSIREDHIETLADSLYYVATQSGVTMGMSVDEIVVSILLVAADITVYSKAIGLVDEQRLVELEVKATEMAEARQKNLEDHGFLDLMREHLSESRGRKPDNS